MPTNLDDNNTDQQAAQQTRAKSPTTSPRHFKLPDSHKANAKRRPVAVSLKPRSRRLTSERVATARYRFCGNSYVRGHPSRSVDVRPSGNSAVNSRGRLPANAPHQVVFRDKRGHGVVVGTAARRCLRGGSDRGKGCGGQPIGEDQQCGQRPQGGGHCCPARPARTAKTTTFSSWLLAPLPELVTHVIEIARQ